MKIFENMNSAVKLVLSLAVIAALVALMVYFNDKLKKESASEEINFVRTGYLEKNNPGLKPDIWYLVYELPGSPAVTAELTFDEASVCYVEETNKVCPYYELEPGRVAHVEGIEKNGRVTVKNLVVLEDVEPGKQVPVKLYYYNEKKDHEISGGNNYAPDEAFLPVDRTIPLTNTPIQDTIRLLIRGELSSAEKTAGFKTEFPHEGFELVGANLKDGILTLEFTEVPGFTTGGSLRIRILTQQIIRTAKQFPEVKEVKFLPEEIFQP